MLVCQVILTTPDGSAIGKKSFKPECIVIQGECSSLDFQCIPIDFTIRTSFLPKFHLIQNRTISIIIRRSGYHIVFAPLRIHMIFRQKLIAVRRSPGSPRRGGVFEIDRLPRDSAMDRPQFPKGFHRLIRNIRGRKMLSGSSISACIISFPCGIRDDFEIAIRTPTRWIRIFVYQPLAR
ncbi:hypothetical protein SDC9_153694 [bioreactor metagenome]|uniref:Uncharacterized protein n=1 Tax=bioreactor metagenome TaxID=1076179 RepID=A0A645EWL3_9ZZZZ